MPPALPDRYHLEVRLGRDEDIDEWLAADTVLDRPVLVRLLGPESTEERREEFLRQVRNVAGVGHSHLSAVYAAAPLPDGAYMVGEWPGGVNFSHRLAAGETLPVDEFLPNASGLAGALAALHNAGHLHGAIDAAAVYFTHAHPAKLGAFGRAPRYNSPLDEVAALADTLETALTGRPPGVVPPSQATDGISAKVDRALDAARDGRLSAVELSDALRAVPSIAPKLPIRPAWSWRWLVPASVLVGLAIAIISLGLILRGPVQEAGGSDFLFPIAPSPTSSTAPQTTPTTTQAPEPGNPAEVLVTGAFSFDPAGDGTEHDSSVPQAHDRDPATTWRTERYFDPLPRLKEGVGIGFLVNGTPGQVAFTITTGTAYSVMWAADPPPGLNGWERIASGTSGPGETLLSLPPRQGGAWLLWFTDLPEREDGFYTDVAEVSFRS